MYRQTDRQTDTHIRHTDKDMQYTDTQCTQGNINTQITRIHYTWPHNEANFLL